MTARRLTMGTARDGLHAVLWAAGALAAGYVALIAEHDAIGAVLLSVAYVAFVPWAILRAGRAAAPVAGRSRTP